MKTRPPWSRRVATQPATADPASLVGAAQRAAAQIPPHAHRLSVSASSVSATTRSGSPARRTSRRRRERSRRPRAQAARLGELPLQRAAGVVGVAGDGRRARRLASRLEHRHGRGAVDATKTSRPERLATPALRRRAPDGRCRRRSRYRVSAARRAARRARRSARHRRSSSRRRPMDELEGRARVVVEPAHERRVESCRGRRRRRGVPYAAAKCARQASQSDSPIRRRVGERGLQQAARYVEMDSARRRLRPWD